MHEVLVILKKYNRIGICFCYSIVTVCMRLVTVEVLDKIGGRENKQTADIGETDKIRNNLPSVTWNLKDHKSNANSFALLSN